MKAIETNVVLAGLMAMALSLHADQTTPPEDPAFTNPEPVSEQTYQALDTQEEPTFAQVEVQAEPTPADDTSSAEPADSAEPAMEGTPVAAETNEDAMAVEPMEEETPVAVESTGAATMADEADAMTNSMGSTGDLTEDSEAVSEGATNNASVIIPLIVMDEVPLMDAIRNLARQAEINYMVDPKVPYGQMGPDGKTSPQPMLSIRWENVTAQQALSAVLVNYNLQMIEDPKSRIQRLSVKDPAAPDPLITQTIQLQYASPTNVLTAINASFTDKRSKVVPDTRTSKLVVVATEKEMVDVEDLVAKLDSPTKQVLIEARLVESSVNPSTIKGIDWSGTLQGQQFSFGNNVAGGAPGRISGGDPSVPFGDNYLLAAPRLLVDTAKGFNPATAFLDADGVSAVLSFLNNNTESKILSSPRTVTLDNETAHIEVGTQYPIINVTAGTANTTGGSQISYSNLTVRLDVTPRISANDTINLHVAPKVMRLDHVTTFNINDAAFDVPIFATREIETSVMIPSGNTLVMGGLIQDNTTKGNIKVPILGDIPVLGLVFRQDSKSREKQNLIVFITPTIVQDSDFQPTPTDFLKTKFEEPDEKDWSAWDSGKPKDWSARN